MRVKVVRRNGEEKIDGEERRGGGGGVDLRK
jgi:hypothetical protein